MRRDRALTIQTSPNGKETFGSEYLLDSVKSVESSSSFTSYPRWSGRRLLRKTLTPPPDKVDFGQFEKPLRSLSFSEQDLRSILENRDDFISLKNELKRKGAVTNSMLKEGIHFYVQNCLEKRTAEADIAPHSPFARQTIDTRASQNALSSS